jgi:type II secretory pathway pseudopilin PulG
MALLAMAAAVAAPTIAFEIKRDREEEFIHRGVQYTRAIKHFAKATGRYPVRLEELQSTNNLRFIRKLYKDPITGKDFRLLHVSDIRLATAAPNLNGTQGNADPASADLANSDGSASENANSPTDPSGNLANSSSDGNPAGAPTAAGSTPQQKSPAPKTDAPGLGAIMGVTSSSKARTIREFERKNHYNQWLFFYELGRDTGFEIKGPTSLTIQSPLGMPTTPSQAPPPAPSSTPQSSQQE